MKPEHTYRRRPKKPVATVPNNAPVRDDLRSRRVALKILSSVSREGLMVDEALARHAGKLDPRDRAFAHALAATVLRHTGWLGAVLNHFMQTPITPGSTEEQLLHIGLAQLALMDGVKPHAAVDTTVELAHALGRGKAAGLINAILRRFEREGATGSLKTPDPSLEIPAWLWPRLERTYGPQARALAEGMLSRAALDIRVRAGGKTPPDAENLPWAKGAVRLPYGIDPTTLPGWAEGKIYVQDGAAQLAATALANGLAGVQNPHVADLCAAPGGKTLHLYDLLPGATLTAVDSDPARLETLEENLARCQAQANVICADVGATGLPLKSFDGVLLDAPCSALGTTRRHPELLHQRSEEQVAHAITLQRSLLKAAAALVKPGGVLVYAVCTMLPQEGEAQMTRFLKENPGWRRLPLAAPLGLEQALTVYGDWLTLPHMGVDGFYIARLQRNTA